MSVKSAGDALNWPAPSHHRSFRNRNHSHRYTALRGVVVCVVRCHAETRVAASSVNQVNCYRFVTSGSSKCNKFDYMAAPIVFIVLSLKLLILKLCKENLKMYVMFINVLISSSLQNSFIWVKETLVDFALFKPTFCALCYVVVCRLTLQRWAVSSLLPVLTEACSCWPARAGVGSGH